MVEFLLLMVYNSFCSWLVVPLIVITSSSSSEFTTPFVPKLQLFLVLVKTPLGPSWQLLLFLVSSSSWYWFNSSYFQLATFLALSQSSSCSWFIIFLVPSSIPLAHGSQFFLLLVVVHVTPNYVNFSCSWFIALIVPSHSSSCSWSLAPLSFGRVTLLSSCSLELWLPTPFPPSLAPFDIFKQLQHLAT